MIELNEESYILGVWFGECQKTLNNWMCIWIKIPGSINKFEGHYRHCYKKDNLIWDSKDEKLWCKISNTKQEEEDEEKIISKMNDIHETIKTMYPCVDKIIVKGDFYKFMEMSKDKIWLHIKEVK